MDENSAKDTLRWADYLRRGCNENACYGLPIENRCDECLFYNAAADEMERLLAENKTLAEFAAKTSDEKMLLLRELKDA